MPHPRRKRNSQPVGNTVYTLNPTIEWLEPLVDKQLLTTARLQSSIEQLLKQLYGDWGASSPVAVTSLTHCDKSAVTTFTVSVYNERVTAVSAALVATAELLERRCVVHVSQRPANISELSIRGRYFPSALNTPQSRDSVACS